MSEIYNEEYYMHYSKDAIVEDYEHNNDLIYFLTGVADRIVSDLHPKTVLDAGCAMGHLVAALRDRGVEAYGVDISDYAISRVREDVRHYCAVGSLTEPLPESLPKHYDLVVTIEVLEHLYAQEGAQAIKNICSLSDTVIFSSTPDEYTERTHVNVQQREYWARLFAENGFLDDLSYRPTYLTYHAVCYRRCADFLCQIEDYERFIRVKESEHKSTLGQYAALQEQYAALQGQSETLRCQLNQALLDYQTVSNAFFWKITKPARAILDYLKRLFNKLIH